ncbi:MAG TPA: PBP1A family penicillin-binding protein [Thermoanaerobaculia bacterium]|jgi:penicillin-binding protein 1B
MQWVAWQLFFLHRRIGRELDEQSWRKPTVIVSNANGRTREVAKVYGTDWRVTPPVVLEKLPKHVADAFLAAEDVRFRRHIGIDPIGIVRAAFTNVRAGGIAQGGSTINQQIIKQRYLTHERTWRRKIIEGLSAIALDARLTKDEVLELYLNDVYLGHHAGLPVLGIDEASRLYFDKLPAQLRVDEAAMLGAMVRAPNRDNPEKRPDIVRARRDAILRVMRDRKWIDEPTYTAAAAREVDVDRGALPEQPFPYFLRALRGEVAQRVSRRALLAGRLTITTTVDPAAQRAAERAASREITRLNARYRWIRDQSRKDPLQVAILSVDPRDGGIRALVGGADRRSVFDHTSSMRRQPGSAFKTFAYLAAIASKKATNSSLLLDAPVKIELSGKETWEPQNYDQQFRGRVTLRESFERSLNVPTVRLTQQVGLRRVADTAKDFGFQGELEKIPALPLGVTDVTVRELTAAYTVFPNLGERVEPFLLVEVKDRRGKSLFRHELKRKRVAGADATYVMHTLLRGVVRRGTATRLKRYDLGYVAGKTGTTNDYRDAWFVGYTADMVTTVWVGFDRGAPLRLSSSEAAIPIWGQYMTAIPHTAANPDPPKGVTFRDIDPESGMLWREGCPGPIREVYLSGTAPTRHCPRGVMGRIVRKILFDEEHFDEPAAITFDQFRRWANDVDRNRQEVEGVVEKMRRWFKKP